MFVSLFPAYMNFEHLLVVQKKVSKGPARVAPLVKYSLVHRKAAGLIPGQDTWVVGSRSCIEGNS